MTGGSEYHCGNCPKEHTKDCPIDLWGSYGNSDIFDGIRRVTNNCLMGCHPSAQAALRAEGAKQALKKLHDACECIPQKETDRDFDKGFHQAMTLVRGWCK